MYPTRNLIAHIETTNATNIPTNNTISSNPLITKPNLINLSKLAPNITGIAKKKVNSAATSLETPINNAPNIVAP